MKKIGGLYLDYYKNPDWMTNMIQAIIFPQKVNRIEEGLFNFSYQGDIYKIQITSKNEENFTHIWIYSNSEELIKCGYKDTRGEFVSTAQTTGFIFLLRNLICQVENIDFIECEAFNSDEFNLIQNRIEARMTNNFRIRKNYNSNFDINKLLKESDLKLNSYEIIELKKIIAQPCNFYFYTSIDKEKTIEEFLLKVGIELDWDNTFLFETLFLPFTYGGMMNRFRTDWAKNSIQELEMEGDKNLEINLVFREDELSFLIKTTTKYFYISEVFWWS
ncbi:MAG: hypothetical protein NXI21_19525 [Alphaproteobacteria bacterium]|nr:hypothetical protein [Alphaproteobacteria bacterium]